MTPLIIMHYHCSMSEDFKIAMSDGRSAYRQGAAVTDNPHPNWSERHTAWDCGYWDEHDDSADAAPADDGIEESYGNWYDTDAVSQGMYDDDPSPYDGNYSEM